MMLFLSLQGPERDILAHISPEMIGCARLMQHSGHAKGDDRIMAAIETVLTDSRHLTRDMGGSATTKELGAAVASAVN